MYDAVIIGAGYGGMSAGALLSNAGRKVVVLEKSTFSGGRAHSFTDGDGYTWEHGSHSHRLADLGIAQEVFSRLGEKIDFVPDSDDQKLIFKKKLWRKPSGPLGFMASTMLSFKAKTILVRLLLRMKTENPFDWYDLTLSDFYRTWFSNKEIENILPFFGLTIMCPDPSRVSAGEVIDFVQRLFSARKTGGEPRNGSRQIFEKLEKHLKKNGELHLNEKATSIMVSDARVKGVKTDRATYETGTVIFASRLDDLFDIVDSKLFNREFESYCTNLEHSSALVLDFITDRPITKIKSGIMGVDVPVWARFKSNTDPSFTPRGKHLSSWGILLPPGFDGNEGQVIEAEKRLSSTINTLFPGFERRVLKQRRLVIPVVNGCVLKPGQSKPHRPQVASPDISGLYFVGDTVQGNGCSGDLSFSSAIKSFELISRNAV